MSDIAVTLKINGRDRALHVPAGETLLETLRDRLGLTGAKRGCNQGVCGACTVLIEGQPVRGCLSLSANCDGNAVTTIEGLAKGQVLAPIQKAFAEAGAVQCGFCSSGMMLAATALIAEHPQATVDEIRAGLAGNLCRCSGYRKIVDAVLSVVAGGSQ
jgi:aerobic-type carbon monoxide dehydrogenase small subunit (CoxS/CutS family)